MNKLRYIYFFGIVLLFLFIQSIFSFDATFMMIALSVSILALWRYFEYEEEISLSKEHKELQERVQSSSKDAHLKNKQLLTIVSSIPFPLILLDQFGNVTMFSNVDEISEGSALTQMSFIKNNFVYPVQEFIKDSFIMERRFERILHIHNVEYQSICVPITTKGKFRGCLLLFQDVSKTLEGEKMQKRFIADASHELKTPIAIIKGMVEILNREDFDDMDTQKEFLTQIEFEINRLDGIVKDLLVLSRLSLSNVLLQKENVDMSKVIQQCIHSFKKQLQEKNMQVVCDFQYKSMVRCDEVKMTQVFMNLISNAIKYSESGTIYIYTKRQQSNFQIQIKDEGVGISQENITKIFERFYRVNDDRSRNSGGSGLGLSIVKSIVEAHNGSISVESVYNEGTVFTILLPLT